MYIAKHFNGRGVDVPTHDADAISLLRDLSDVFLKIRNMIHGFFDASFDRLAERPVFFTTPSAVGVVEAVDFEQGSIAPVAEMGEEYEIFSHRIEDIPMQNEVTAGGAFVNVIFDDRKVFESEREKRAYNIVVVSAEVDDLGIALLQFLEDDADEARVSLSQLTGAFELPSVDDVTVEDKFLAADVTEEVVYFLYFAISSAEVDIRKDDSADAEVLFIHGVKGRKG